MPRNQPNHFSTLPIKLATEFLLSSSLILKRLCFLFLQEKKEGSPGGTWKLQAKLQKVTLQNGGGRTRPCLNARGRTVWGREGGTCSPAPRADSEPKGRRHGDWVTALQGPSPRLWPSENGTGLPQRWPTPHLWNLSARTIQP